MKEAMEKWLSRHQITFSVDTAHSLCNRFSLDTEKMDGCYMLIADLETNRITQEEFTAGLCVLTGKEPEEVMGILKGVDVSPTPEAMLYHGVSTTKNLQSIVSEGLKAGSFVSDLTGQSFTFPIIVEFSDVPKLPAAYRPGDFILRGASGTPTALYVEVKTRHIPTTGQEIKGSESLYSEIVRIVGGKIPVRRIVRDSSGNIDWGAME